MAKPIDDDAEDQDGNRGDPHGKDCVVDSVGGQRLAGRGDSPPATLTTLPLFPLVVDPAPRPGPQRSRARSEAKPIP